MTAGTYLLPERFRPAPDFIADCIDRLVGQPVISLDEFYQQLSGGRDPKLMPVTVRNGLCHVLEQLGYSGRMMVERGTTEERIMWVRAPWPADFGAFEGRKLQCFVRA